MRMSLWSELSRRNVSRVTVLYVVTAWLILQVTDVLVSLIDLPAAAGRIVFLVLAAGLPIAVASSWFFELTPSGLERESESTVHDRSVSRRVDYVIIGILAAAVLVLLTDRMFLSEHAGRPGDADPSRLEMPTVAVLPFSNLSADEAARYFIDGMHDDILTRISKLDSLHVISRTSVARYRDTEESIPAIAEALGASFIIEGGVQKFGDKVRVNVQLIDGRRDQHVWAETYDREMTLENMFALQTSLAGAIADALEVSLAPDERAAFAKVPTLDVDAYQAYVRARELVAKRTSGDLHAARELLQKAIERDPQFAPAYSELARAYALLANYANLPTSEAHPRAREAAERSLELDPDLAEAHGTLGLLEMLAGNRQAAFDRFERAISLNPNDPSVYDWYGVYLFNTREDEERGLRYLRLAARLDPLAPIINYHLAGTLARTGEVSQAEERLQRLLRYVPEAVIAHTGLAEIAMYARHDHESAVRHRLQAQAMDPGDPDHAVNLALLLIDLGDIELGARWLQRAADLRPKLGLVLRGHIALALRQGSSPDAALEAFVSRPGYSVDRFPFVARARRDRHWAQGNLDAALDVYAGYPGLLDDEPPTLTKRNFSLAIDAAALLLESGDRRRATRLLAAAEPIVAKMPPVALDGSDIANVEILALRGESDAALRALEQTIDAGWLFLSWWLLDQNPNLAALRELPECRRLIARLETERRARLDRIHSLDGIRPE